VGAQNIYDAIVRFVDVDVKPGYTYKYQIQVRMKNPNFGKKNEVVQGAWAEWPELYSKPVDTQTFRIPGAYHVFAVDQLHVDEMGKDSKDPTFKKFAQDQPKTDGNHAAMQIHRWFGKEGREDFLISDWAIAERVVVRKGDPIGGTFQTSTMVVEEPTWSKGRGAFDMKSQLVPKTKGKGTDTVKGVPLDFFYAPFFSRDGKAMTGPPVLVEIEGGKKTNAKVGTSIVPHDEAATELLILTPDGRLILRDSRADHDAKIDNGTEAGTDRQARVLEWRKRNRETGGTSAGGGQQGGPGKGILPGGGN
jgi:hypothetical protein